MMSSFWLCNDGILSSWSHSLKNSLSLFGDEIANTACVPQIDHLPHCANVLNEKCFFIWRLPILYRIYVTNPSVIPHILKYGYIIIIPVLCVANVHYTSHCWIQRYYNPLLEINNFGLASKNDPITHTLNFTYRSLTCTSCTFENFLMSAVFPLLPHKPIVRYIDFITTSPTSLKQFSSHVYKCWPTSIDLCCKEKITCLWWRKYALEAIVKLLFISLYHDRCLLFMLELY